MGRDFLLLPLSIYSDDIHVYAFTLFSFSFPEAFVVADDDDDDFRNCIQSQLRVFFFKFSSTERRELPKREMRMTLSFAGAPGKVRGGKFSKESIEGWWRRRCV